MTYPVNDLRRYLVQPWCFQRQIVHRDTGQVANMHGTVSWQAPAQPDALTTLRYCEMGVIQMAHYTGKASQTYRYAFASDSISEVYFSDGRFFYTLDLTTGHCEIRHVCGEDIYDGVFEAVSETTYQQTWRVMGPRKDYTSHTVFSR